MNIKILFLLSLAALTSCSRGLTEATEESTTVTIVRLDVNPKVVTVPSNVVIQYSATAIRSDGTSYDVTQIANWATSDTAIIDNFSGARKGEMRSGSSGQVTITVSLNEHEISTTALVSSATLTNIAITPSATSLPLGLTDNFVATGYYSDSSSVDLTQTVVWASDATSVATVSNSSHSRGLVTSHTTGTANISATHSSQSDTATLTVSAAALTSIVVTPAHSTIAAGTTAQMVATGNYTDGTTQDITTSVLWSSSSTTVANVNNAMGLEGQATGLVVGTTTLVATLSSVSGQTTLSVSSAELVSVSISPSSPTIPSGLSQQLTVTGTYTDASTQDLTATAQWSTSDASVATVSIAPGSEGLVQTGLPGTATITADVQGITNSITLTVSTAQLLSVDITPISPSVAVGLNTNLTATGTYSNSTTMNITNSVTWSSSNPAIVSVSNTMGTNGRIRGEALGSATITATLGSVTNSTSATATAPVLLSIAVTPHNSTCTLFATKQFTATGTYSDSSTQNLTATASWTTNNSSLAGFLNVLVPGLITCLTVSTVQVQATVGSITGTTTLN